ncbi:MAG: hypothetical protein GXY44_11335 [Phycisphaerales bacterium]|nr:hypothetical protein [Phycisphaerales bacterium]
MPARITPATGRRELTNQYDRLGYEVQAGLGQGDELSERIGPYTETSLRFARMLSGIKRPVEQGLGDSDHHESPG